MKKFLVPVLLFILLTGCSNNAETPEQLADMVIEQLKKNDSEGFQSFIFSNEDALEILEMGLMKFEAEGKQQRIVDTKAMIEAIHSGHPEESMLRAKKQTSQSFSALRKQASKDGVDWNNIKLLDKQKTEKEVYGNHKADVVIVFESGGNRYAMKINDAMKVSRGWILTDELRWYGKE